MDALIVLILTSIGRRHRSIASFQDLEKNNSCNGVLKRRKSSRKKKHEGFFLSIVSRPLFTSQPPSFSGCYAPNHRHFLFTFFMREPLWFFNKHPTSSDFLWPNISSSKSLSCLKLDQRESLNFRGKGMFKFSISKAWGGSPWGWLGSYK